ncbi:hypothetical protein DEGR_33490 (plasmid) [Deinococcus grandis]|nr:hypothetical protein DEGR_33490 [Deinococcus grandis]
MRGGPDRDAPLASQRRRSSWQLRAPDGRPLADALVRSDSGARLHRPTTGTVHLDAPRERSAPCTSSPWTGRPTPSPAHTEQAQLTLDVPGGPA